MSPTKRTSKSPGKAPSTTPPVIPSSMSPTDLRALAQALSDRVQTLTAELQTAQDARDQAGSLHATQLQTLRAQVHDPAMEIQGWEHCAASRSQDLRLLLADQAIEIRDLTGRLDRAFRQRDGMRDDNDHLLREMAFAGSEIHQLQSRIHDLERDLEDSQTASAAADESLDRLRDELRLTQEEVVTNDYVGSTHGGSSLGSARGEPPAPNPPPSSPDAALARLSEELKDTKESLEKASAGRDYALEEFRDKAATEWADAKRTQTELESKLRRTSDKLKDAEATAAKLRDQLAVAHVQHQQLVLERDRGLSERDLARRRLALRIRQLRNDRVVHLPLLALDPPPSSQACPSFPQGQAQNQFGLQGSLSGGIHIHVQARIRIHVQARIRIHVQVFRSPSKSGAGSKSGSVATSKAGSVATSKTGTGSKAGSTAVTSTYGSGPKTGSAVAPQPGSTSSKSGSSAKAGSAASMSGSASKAGSKASKTGSVAVSKSGSTPKTGSKTSKTGSAVTPKTGSTSKTGSTIAPSSQAVVSAGSAAITPSTTELVVSTAQSGSSQSGSTAGPSVTTPAVPQPASTGPPPARTGSGKGKVKRVIPTGCRLGSSEDDEDGGSDWSDSSGPPIRSSSKRTLSSGPYSFTLDDEDDDDDESPEDSEEARAADDALEEDTRRALSQSRSEARWRSLSTPPPQVTGTAGSGAGTAGFAIQVDSDGGSDSDGGEGSLHGGGSPGSEELALLQLWAITDPEHISIELLALDDKCWRRLGMLFFASKSLVLALVAALERVAKGLSRSSDRFFQRVWQSQWRNYLHEKVVDCRTRLKREDIRSDSLSRRVFDSKFEANLVAPRLVQILTTSLRVTLTSYYDSDQRRLTAEAESGKIVAAAGNDLHVDTPKVMGSIMEVVDLLLSLSTTVEWMPAIVV
ncbi:hypothetical protein PInf_017681 [Phytophthora infestans]|nr:hypothetical protein PInf_017681 [Phytophthora infestans]